MLCTVCWEISSLTLFYLSAERTCLFEVPFLNFHYSKKIKYFLLNEKVQVAYDHPLSHSCGGLEGPFGPC